MLGGRLSGPGKSIQKRKKEEKQCLVLREAGKGGSLDEGRAKKGPLGGERSLA